MFTKKILTSFALTSFACAGISQGAVALFIDDFRDSIGDSGEGDMNVLFSNTVEALTVNVADTSDTTTVAQTMPAGTTRTALATISSFTSGSGVAGTFATFPVGALGGLSLQINDGSEDDSLDDTAGDTADFSFAYDFAPVFDATAGGLLDTVEIKVEFTDWTAAKGSMAIEFVEAGSGDIATWSVSPNLGVHSELLANLTGAGSVDFSNISDVTLSYENGYDLDVTFSNFGLSGTGIPEPSSALLALIGSGFLIARRRRA